MTILLDCVITRLNDHFTVMLKDEWNDYYDSYKTPTNMEWKHCKLPKAAYDVMSISIGELAQQYLRTVWSEHDDN